MIDRSTARRLETSPSASWHTLTPAEVEQVLQTGPDGLQEAEAGRRIAQGS